MRLNLRRNFHLCLQVDISSLRLLSVAMSINMNSPVVIYKWNSKVCLERDLKPRPRLSRADVLTTTTPRQLRYRAAEMKALGLTGLPKKILEPSQGPLEGF